MRGTPDTNQLFHVEFPLVEKVLERLLGIIGDSLSDCVRIITVTVTLFYTY